MIKPKNTSGLFLNYKCLSLCCMSLILNYYWAKHIVFKRWAFGWKIVNSENLPSAKQRLDKSKKDNYARLLKAKKHAEKQQRIQDFIDCTRKAVKLKDDSLKSLVDKLSLERQAQVKVLTDLIFPVEEVKLCR